MSSRERSPGATMASASISAAVSEAVLGDTSCVLRYDSIKNTKTMERVKKYNVRGGERSAARLWRLKIASQPLTGRGVASPAMVAQPREICGDNPISAHGAAKHSDFGIDQALIIANLRAIKRI
ncbi:hypothetical protein EVAR_3679_1 [Eumeta japonica]|uniref:Uncharacterized protein n=1 Tax=Eumeta variegata TaxID=151549 RepID=A0A4C1SRF1_EUMVA|nr:hypothetical protein EVAR_3679_1 [Eumeta japonica]